MSHGRRHIQTAGSAISARGETASPGTTGPSTKCGHARISLGLRANGNPDLCAAVTNAPCSLPFHPMNAQETWLTQEAFDRLQAELADRSGPIRDEIKDRIAQAREEGDLRENGGYHAAREEQGKNEARINELTHLLEHAKIGAPEVEAGVVAHGR